MLKNPGQTLLLKQPKAKLRKPLMLCDMDGVIADCDGPMYAELNKRGYPLKLQECDHYGATRQQLTTICGLPEEQAEELLADIWWSEGFLANQPIILPMLSSLRRLAGMMRAIHVVTARKIEERPWVAPTTKQWLDSYGIPYDKLVFQSDKAAYVREHKVDYVVEDAPHHAQNCFDAGARVFLIDCPYNQHIQEQDGLWRIHHPSEIADYLRLDLERSAS